MFKRSVFSCIIAGTLLGMNTYAANSVINKENTEVVITGDGAAAEENVTLVLLKPGENIENINDANAKEKIQYLYQSLSDKNGNFKFLIALTEDMAVGEYTARIFKASSVSEDDVDKCSFYFVTESERNTLTQNFNTAEDIAPLIDKLLIYESVDSKILSDGTESDNTIYRDEIIAVFKRMRDADKKTEFASLSDVKKMFYAAAAEVQIKKNPDSLNKVLKCLEVAESGISATEYTKYEKFIKQNFGEYSVTTAKTLFETINKEIAVEMVNEATRDNISRVLANSCDILGLSENIAYKKYVALSGENAGKANAKLAGGGYKSNKEIADNLKKITDELPSGDSENRGSTGGGTKKVNLTVETKTPAIDSDEPKSVCGFKDLSGCEWAKDSIEMFFERGYISGRSSDKFEPLGKITRAEFVKIAVLAFDLTDDTAQCSFGDCTAGDWFYRFAASAEKAGIITGNNGLFNPNEYITRQDIAVILDRVISKCNIEIESTDAEGVQFADDAQIGDYAKNSIYRLRGRGIMNGDQNNMSCAMNNATRAEATALMHRIYLYK